MVEKGKTAACTSRRAIRSNGAITSVLARWLSRGGKNNSTEQKGCCSSMFLVDFRKKQVGWWPGMTTKAVKEPKMTLHGEPSSNLALVKSMMVERGMIVVFWFFERKPAEGSKTKG